MAFYCYGKQGICICDILCADCKFYDDKGGKEVQTNADRIRAMSDEEITKAFGRYVFCGLCPLRNKCTTSEFIPCSKVVLEWLQQPAEVDNG